MGCVEAIVEPGRERQNDATMVTGRQLLEAPVFLVQADSMSLWEMKSPMPQFLAAPYLFDVEESPAAALEKVGRIDVLPGDLDGEADQDLSNLT